MVNRIKSVFMDKFFSKEEDKEEEVEEEIILMPLSELLEMIKNSIENYDGLSEKNQRAEIRKFYDSKRSRFECNKNPSIEKFINEITDNSAVSWEIDRRARTYFLVNNKKSMETEKIEIVAFFTIGITSLSISETIKKSRRRRTFGSSNETFEICYLIGKLGKDDKYKKSVDGKLIIEFCINIIHMIHLAIGRRVVLIEAYEDKVCEIYRECGFEIFQTIEDKGRKRKQLIKSIYN